MDNSPAQPETLSVAAVTARIEPEKLEVYVSSSEPVGSISDLPPLPPSPPPPRRHKKPKKSILKAPTVTPQRFNFKRDILNPLNARLSSYTTGSINPPVIAPPSPVNALTNAFRKFTDGTALQVPLTRTIGPSTQQEKREVNSQTPSSVKNGVLAVSNLKKVRFTMSSLTVVYPLQASLPPVEEAPTRDRVENEHRSRLANRAAVPDTRGWSASDLYDLYIECCRTREEPGTESLRRLLRDAPSDDPPKNLDLTGQLLTHGSVDVLSDLLSVDFGLKKLVLENCGLDDDSLKPLLNALLVSGTLPTLSLANNRRIKAKGWRLLATFVRKAKSLKFLDISDNPMDKRSIDLLIQAIQASPKVTSNSPASTSKVESYDEEEMSYREPLNPTAELLKDQDLSSKTGLISLRIENCTLRNQSLEALAHGLRMSQVQNVSLRRNTITSTGAVAVALLMRDYPVANDNALPTLDVNSWTFVNTPSPSASTDTLSVPIPEPSSSITARQTSTGELRRLAPSYVPPPSPTPSLNGKEDEENENGGGVIGPEKTSVVVTGVESKRAAENRLRLKKQFDEMPRLGHLRVLDVKGNDIKTGVVYIAQVLKRNRTLRVLNLSENGINSQGLVALSEALKYNTCLETLDLSRNPCCGPTSEGIIALRSAFVINGSLKRIYLNATNLATEGAIALAEFLPDAQGLIQLDLAENHSIEMAGVLALAVSLKMNRVLRCLDLDIPPNDPDFAHLSQDLLQTCSRNIQLAQDELAARGIKHSVAAPMAKSAVARNLKYQQELAKSKVRARGVDNGPQRMLPPSRRGHEIKMMNAAEEVRAILEEILNADEAIFVKDGKVEPKDFVRELLEQGKLALAQLQDCMQSMRPDRLEEADELSNKLASELGRATQIYDPPKPSPPPDPNQIRRRRSLESHNPPKMDLTDPDGAQKIQESLSPSSPVSPAFSITDSDEDLSDAEEISSPEGPQKRHLTIDMGMAKSGSGLPSPKSPTGTHSRDLTMEEGEVFRKGTALQAVKVDSDDEDGGTDKDSEALKQEILDAQVERIPRVVPSTPPDSPPPVYDDQDNPQDQDQSDYHPTSNANQPTTS